ncbi:hypothetical protein ABK040_009546 [Willaertia magna]
MQSLNHLLISRHVERLSQLLNHIFPERLKTDNKRLINTVINNDKVFISDNVEEYNFIKEEKFYNNLINSFQQSIYLLLIGNLGDFSSCGNMSIHNAINDYSQQFELYSKCIININQDLFNILYLIENIINNQIKIKYKMICNYDLNTSVKYIKNWSTKLLQSSTSSITNFNNLNIIYWSGHGEKELGLQFQENHLSYNTFFNLLNIKHLNNLFIMECCHTNIEIINNFVNKSKSKFETLFLCSSSDKSGAWVCDGIDSGGILSKFLMDPVSTYFKVKYKIFFDLGEHCNVYFPYNSNSIKYNFYEILDYYLTKMIKIVFTKDFLIFLSENTIIRVLYKHFLLFYLFSNELYQPQKPYSYPTIQISDNQTTQSLLSTYLNQMQQDIETKLIEIYNNNNTCDR